MKIGFVRKWHNLAGEEEDDDDDEHSPIYGKEDTICVACGLSRYTLYILYTVFFFLRLFTKNRLT